MIPEIECIYNMPWHNFGAVKRHEELFIAIREYAFKYGDPNRDAIVAASSIHFDYPSEWVSIVPIKSDKKYKVFTNKKVIAMPYVSGMEKSIHPDALMFFFRKNGIDGVVDLWSTSADYQGFSGTSIIEITAPIYEQYGVHTMASLVKFISYTRGRMRCTTNYLAKTIKSFTSEDIARGKLIGWKEVFKQKGVDIKPNW
jgi:hypothetical protein